MAKTDKVIYTLIALFFIGLVSMIFSGKESPARGGETKAEVETCTGAGLEDRIKKSQEATARKDHESVILSLGRCHTQLAEGSDAQKLLNKASAAVGKKQAEEKKRELAEWKKAGVHIGMTQERVMQSSWGKPQKINTTTTKHGTREQWVYNRSYLYFENDLLTAIQN
jgi:hypothetical protein